MYRYAAVCIVGEQCDVLRLWVHLSDELYIGGNVKIVEKRAAVPYLLNLLPVADAEWLPVGGAKESVGDFKSHFAYARAKEWDVGTLVVKPHVRCPRLLSYDDGSLVVLSVLAAEDGEEVVAPVVAVVEGDDAEALYLDFEGKNGVVIGGFKLLYELRYLPRVVGV